MPLTGIETDLLLAAGGVINEPKKEPKPKKGQQPEKPLPEVEPNTIRAHTIGLWKNGQRYMTSPIVKKRLPSKWARLLFIKNKHKSKSSHPDYVGYFVESDAEYKEIKSPYLALREAVEDEYGYIKGEGPDDYDLAAKIFDWMKENEQLLIEAIHVGWDSSEVLYFLERHFNRPTFLPR